MIDALFRKILDSAFPGIKPFDLVWGPALSPLKAELLGLKRNVAKGEVELEYLYANFGVRQFYAFYEAPRRLPLEIIKLNRLQARRAQRIAEIVAKLERDGRMKGPKQTTPGSL